MRILLTALLLTLSLAGCTNEKPTGTLDNKEKATMNEVSDKWQVSPTFEMTAKDGEGREITVKWVGEKGRLAITDNPFIAGQTQKYMWLFWGNENEIIGKKYKVTAISQTGTQQSVLTGESLGGANWGAPASSPSLISLPSKGLWRLDAYIEDKLFGSIVVEVK